MMYNKLVQDCFFLPKHAGIIDAAHGINALVKNSQKNQGTIEFYIHCNAKGVVERARFKTNGNPYVIASLEWVCRQLEGNTIDNLPQIDYLLLIKKLDIPHSHYPIALRIIDLYKEAMLLIKKKRIN